MAAKAFDRFSTWSTSAASFARVLANSLLLLAILELVTGVVGGVVLILHERHTCGGFYNELYALRCTTSNPYIVLGAAVIVGTIAQGILLLMAAVHIVKRVNAVSDGRQSEDSEDC